MLLLKPVYMPETCYVLEAAYWLAFGRVPEFLPHEDQGDMRTLTELMISGDGNGLDYYDQGYEEIEFASIGQKDIDFDRYMNGCASSTGNMGEWRVGFIDRLENDPPNPNFPDFSEEERRKLLEEVKAEHARDVADAEYAESLHRLMRPTLSRAKAAVFQAIASGELRSFGYIETDAYRDRLDNDDPRAPWPDGDECLVRGDIPADIWTLDDFDWKESTLKAPVVAYTHVQVSTEDMLRAFPTPSGPGIPMEPSEILVFGGVLVVKNAAPASRASKRGRPERAYTIKAAIQNWLKATLKANPAYASEAPGTIQQDAIVFAQTYLGELVSRTTVQGYLAEFLPEIAAEKSPKIAAE